MLIFLLEGAAPGQGTMKSLDLTKLEMLKFTRAFQTPEVEFPHDSFIRKYILGH